MKTRNTLTSFSYRAMKRILNLLLLLPVILCSCDRGNLELTDNSFKYRLEVSYDSESAQYGLDLTFLSGAKDTEFTMDYSIDSNRSVCLLDADGNPFRTGSRVSFRESNTLHFLLPSLAAGEHSLDVVLSTEIYSRQEGCRFTIDRVPLALHAEVNVNRENPASILLVSLKEGLLSRTYSIQVSVDGNTVSIPEGGSEIDFSKTPIFSLTLPCVRPGMHSMKVTLSDSQSSCEVELTFEEPLRYPTLDLTLSYNKSTGNHELTVSRNPYGIRIIAKAKLVISGSCTYYETNALGWTYDNPYSFRTTKTKKTTDEKDVDTVSSGTFCIAERDLTVTELTSDYVFSAIWKLTGGSEDIFYTVTGYEPVYYNVTKEELSVDFDIESLPGVKVILRNDISGCTVSGIE